MTTVPYQLRYPITGTIGQEPYTIASVTIRRPTGKEMREMDSHVGDLAKSLAMIEALTGLSGFQVDKLDVVDITGMGRIIEGFMEPGPPTGPTS